MDTIDKQIKIKKFLKLIFRDFNEEEYIRIFQNNKDIYSKVEFFNNIDDLVRYCSSNTYNCNTYFQLATTTGIDGKEENLLYRYCLAFDFDKKDFEEGFNHKDILNKFKALKIHYHAIVETGNGYHIYVCINKTNDFKKVHEVQKVLATKLESDLNAIKSTQILRVPYTFNVKDKAKLVRIIHMDDRHNQQFRPYDINFLYQMNCCSIKDRNIIEDNKATQFVLDNNTFPKCLEEVLENGSSEGSRYYDLQNIVVALRNKNKSINEIQLICKEWGNKSNYRENLEYKVNHIFENKRCLEFNCKECKEKCFNAVESDFDLIIDKEEYGLIHMVEKNAKDLKYKKRKGSKFMNGNDLFIYNVLINNKDRELNIDEIMELITYKRKSKIKNLPLTLKYVRESLNRLCENEYIKKTTGIKKLGIKDTYSINKVRCSLDKEFQISYFCTLAVIWGVISCEELRLYTHMRYKHHLELKEGKSKGNIFRINQSELANDLGVTQQRISDMVEGLIESKILEIWEVKLSENGFRYYTYRLNK